MRIYSTLAISLLATAIFSACNPPSIDPPLNFNTVRQDTKVDALTPSKENPLNTMGVTSLWKRTTGRSVDGGRVRVAIVGTGVDYTIPDIRTALWMNMGEFDETHRANGKDDDNNGTVDDIFGYDFFSGDNMPYDWHGHDTYTASLVASVGQLNQEVIGVAPNAELMVVRYMGPDARTEANKTGIDAQAALEYALKNQAKIIYFNWPNGGFTAMEEALLLTTFQKIDAANILVVTPAGNTANQNVPKLVREMAKMKNTIVVAAVGKDGKILTYSNSGKATVTIAAPAEGGKGFFIGGQVSDQLRTTSVAAAYVAGASALLAGLPGLGSAEKIRTELLSKAATAKNKIPLDVLAGGSISLESFASIK